VNGRASKVAALLFGSGACALVYQVAWLREMRLIFGASTAASAAVLAIFMGGLGLGGALFGQRVDRRPNPLVFYAHLELIVAASAAVTPGLLWVVRQLYVQLGGSAVLGLGGATLVRLLLAALVLGIPTLAMGGTLPAASKAVETPQDVGRRNLAVVYATNTLGAVTGAFVSTFFLLETFGTRRTLWIACFINALVAITARILARSTPAVEASANTIPRSAKPVSDFRTASGVLPEAPPTFVLGAAATVGFAFLLMELVWYRMLAPLLGGSSFTFGLILALALLGIGAGGAAYALLGNDRPATLRGFALTCALEAVCISLPYALGDRIAFLAIFLRPLASLGFYSLVLGWTMVAGIVVLPAAFVAGVQFPLIIALLGRGGERVGRHVGFAYAWNTAGAILGSLAGGFGLLPLLSATGTWRAVVVLLVALGLIAMLLSARVRGQLLPLMGPLAAAVAAMLLIGATGPTAVWRHSPIGAGRVDLHSATRNTLQDWANARRRVIAWQADGVESSVGLDTGNGYAFVLNGKTDGNVLIDAPTQVMSGLVGAIIHPHPTRALVVGLGTGSTAGWLGAIPAMQRVDVVELEPAIAEVARACAPVNQNALANPKIHLVIGDGREVLLTTPERYDIIASEPSNPYRAGVASLFTQEFYRAVATRLAEGGIFLQWMQAYEVDSQTIRSVYATLASVFPVVETWRTHKADLLLVASMHPITYEVPTLRARVGQEPFSTALAVAWRTTGLEGFLSRFMARSSLAVAFAQVARPLNTDNRPLIEFAFARSVGRLSLFDSAELSHLARTRGEDRPQLSGGDVDWGVVEDERIASFTADGVAPPVDPEMAADQRSRAKAQAHYIKGALREALAAWRAQPREPRGPVELALVAESLANNGDESARRYIDQLRNFEPVEADALVGVLRWRQARLDEATAAYEAAFRGYQRDPWPLPGLMSRQLNFAIKLGATDAARGRRLYAALKAPFSASVLDQERRMAAFRLAARLGAPYCVEALQSLEPHVPWKRGVLFNRLACYQGAGDLKVARAREDLEAFLAAVPLPLGYGLKAPVPQAAP
jgi:spermidine synthase